MKTTSNKSNNRWDQLVHLHQWLQADEQGIARQRQRAGKRSRPFCPPSGRSTKRPFGAARQLAGRCLLTLGSLATSSCIATTEGDEAIEKADVGTQEQEVKNGYVMANGAPIEGAVRVEFWSYDEQKWRICSGQIVARRALVTAGHCPEVAGFPGASGTWPTQVFRQTDQNPPQNMLGGWVYATVEVHPDYVNNYDLSNDVAVVKVATNWPGVVSQDAAVIAKGSQHQFDAWVVGYGNYDTGTNDYDGQLRAKQEYMYYDTSNPKSYQNWANGSEPWLCTGDSGGPLLTQFLGGPMMWGVASGIEEVTGSCGRKGYWAPTTENWSWISQKVGGCQDKWSYIDCWN